MSNTHTEHFVPAGWEQEIASRIDAIAQALTHMGADAALLADNIDLYYTSGRVFNGFTYITAQGQVHYYVRRPLGYESEPCVTYVHKPELIPGHLERLPHKLAMMADTMPQAQWARLSHAFDSAEAADGSAAMRQLRAVKSGMEQQLLRESARRHVSVYKQVPTLYRSGMTDLELEIEIERQARLAGSTGLVRCHGDAMEMFMGSLLAGDNADEPSPYDFAMGGAGINLSQPVGANGSIIKLHTTIMVDMGMNYGGYMTDMTRTYAVGNVPDIAKKAHQLSVDINHRLAREGRHGVEARELYATALEMTQEAGLADYFMGHRQHAGFVGHGIGLETNEAPVLAPRSRDVLHTGQVIAIEPKYVLPGIGAVGIENTYIVQPHCLECITTMPEELHEMGKPY